MSMGIGLQPQGQILWWLGMAMPKQLLLYSAEPGVLRIRKHLFPCLSSLCGVYSDLHQQNHWYITKWTCFELQGSRGETIQQQLLLLLFPELLSSLSFPCPVLLLLCLHPISECLLTAQWEPYWWAFLLLIQRPNSTRHWPPCQYHFFLGCCNGPCCMAVTVVALAPRKRVELLWVLLLYSLGNKNVKEGPQYKKMLFECLFTY